MSSVPVSVVLVACEDSPPLRRCLAIVAEQARDLSAEVVLVLNAEPGSLPAGSRAALEALGARLDFEPAVGKSHALNRGVRVAAGKVVAFTDDDTLPRPGWLRGLCGPLLAPDRPPDLAGCGGRVTPSYEACDPPAWFVRLVESRPTSFLGPRHDLGPEPCDYGCGRPGARAPIGANCAYRREVLLRHPFDPSLGPNRATGMRGGEDIAVGTRVREAGHRVRYVPEAEVLHPVVPERATEEYARLGHFTQGVERIRSTRLFGRREIRAETIRRRLRRNRLLRHTLFFLPRWQRIRRDLRAEMFRGMLAEIEGSADRRLAELGLSAPSSGAPRR